MRLVLLTRYFCQRECGLRKLEQHNLLLGISTARIEVSIASISIIRSYSKHHTHVIEHKFIPVTRPHPCFFTDNMSFSCKISNCQSVKRTALQYPSLGPNARLCAKNEISGDSQNTVCCRIRPSAVKNITKSPCRHPKERRMGNKPFHFTHPN
ncbi:unknown [Bacteroides sp. CAG:462]|nr:unknown [Bacteroides sp. CAG:462]